MSDCWPKHDHSSVPVSLMCQLSYKAHWLRLRSPLWESAEHIPTADEEIRTGVTLNNKEGPWQSGAVDTTDCNWNSVYAAVWNAPLTSPHAVKKNEKEAPLFAVFRPGMHISIICQTEWQTSGKDETCMCGLWKPAMNGPAALLPDEPTRFFERSADRTWIKPIKFRTFSLLQTDKWFFFLTHHGLDR